MSNILSTCKEEVNSAGEIELTDAQLMAVYGACEDEEREDECRPVWQPECEDRHVWGDWDADRGRSRSRVKCVKKFHEKISFSFKLSIQEEKEVDRDVCVVR